MSAGIFQALGIISVCVGTPFIVVLVAAHWPEITRMPGYTDEYREPFGDVVEVPVHDAGDNL